MPLKIAEYDRNILKLFSGTAIAQGVSFCTIPIVAKLYGPSEYGTYGGFFAAVMILSVLATARYELAIMTPEDDDEVAIIMKLTSWITLIVCFGAFVIIAFIPLSLLNALLDVKSGSRIAFILIPVGAYLLAQFQIYNNWLVRKKQYLQLSVNKLLRSFLFALTSIAIGLIAPKAVLLAVSLIVSHIASNIFLRVKNIELRLDLILFPSKALRFSMLKAANAYRQYPAYILPAELMNVICTQLPVFVFLWCFNSSESGYFSFIISLLNIPISLLANAILDVFKEKASSDYRREGSCQAVYLSTLKKMVVVAILPFIVLYFFGSNLITLFFGEEWSQAGKFLDVLLPMFFFKFISSPLSFVFYIVNRQKEDFLWHMYIMATNLIALYIGAGIYRDILLAVRLYSINFTIIYIIYLIRSFQLSRHKIFS
ncbi:lipopolysaccharide biosynthesis protein [Pedobacter faecalis]|uniref:lipopolysaccharide biosynthesis protein n=1 Tax=Pedobacter faecalis TaxID=3041495 RepID=UPI00254A4DD9|nr:lipopolysaccharide biosynthesis protein [Pedobacter sp. ELA7]